MTVGVDLRSPLVGLCHFMRAPTWEGIAFRASLFLAELLDASRVAVLLADHSGERLVLSGSYAAGDAMWNPQSPSISITAGHKTRCPMTATAVTGRFIVTGLDGGYDFSRCYGFMPVPRGEEQFAFLPLRDDTLGLLGVAVVVGSAPLADRVADPAFRLAIDTLSCVIGERRQAHILSQRARTLEAEVMRQRHTRGIRRFRSGTAALIGSSDTTRAFRQQVKSAAAQDSLVLLLGNPGTGRQEVAKSIHDNSSRRNRPLVYADVSTVGPGSAMPLLVGHKSGLLSGQTGTRGFFQEAGSGTVCLRGLETLTPAEQNALMRIMDSGTYAAVGSARDKKLTARVIVLAPASLPHLVKDGTFSTALFQVLHEEVLEVPALTMRREDIPDLCEFFITEMKLDRPRPIKMSPVALAEIVGRDLRENLPELRALVRTAVLRLGQYEDIILPKHLHVPRNLRNETELGLKPALARFESALIRRSLDEANGDRAEAARQLNIPKRTLADKCHKYAI